MTRAERIAKALAGGEVLRSYQIAAALGCGSGTVGSAISEMRITGLVESVGFRRGWRITDAGKAWLAGAQRPGAPKPERPPYQKPHPDPKPAHTLPVRESSIPAPTMKMLMAGNARIAWQR